MKDKIIVEPPAKVAPDKWVIPLVFPTWRTNLTVEQADQLRIDLAPAIVKAWARKKGFQVEDD